MSTFPNPSEGLVITASVSLGWYAGTFVGMAAGFVWLLSPGCFKHAWFIFRRAIPWLCPKILSLLAFMAFLPARMVWVFLVIFNAEVEAEFIVLQVSFMLLLTHITLFVSYWVDSLIYFARKKYGARRTEGRFFNYRVTRWGFVAAITFIYGLKGLLMLIYLVARATTEVERNAAVTDKVTLVVNSVMIFALLAVFFGHAIVVAVIIIRASRAWKDLVMRLGMVVGIFAIFAFVEVMKIAVFIYRLSLNEYDTGSLPQEAYLLMAFVIPDLVPSIVLVTLEFITRRKAICEQLAQVDMFYEEQHKKRSHGKQRSTNPHSRFDSRAASGDLDYPLLPLAVATGGGSSLLDQEDEATPRTSLSN